MLYFRELCGESLGTFVLTIFGCGSVASTILFGAHQGLFQIALIWGIAVTLAIYLTRHLCCAHLNPAVSIAMVIGGRMQPRKLPTYLVAQFGGAFLAGMMLYLLFSPSIAAYEASHGIIRGTTGSMKTAAMFGEYYIHPETSAVVSLPLAIAAEAFGTFLLVLMIFALTEGCNVGRPHEALAPVFIGLSVSSIICLIAPLTQAGLNPARDFSPRLVAWMMGWGSAAFPDQQGGFFYVYILGPVLGGIAASGLFILLLEKLMNKQSTPCGCPKRM
ncbi:aquaporin family protein [Desulfobulbus rhabdoformis]|uniref:MIP/aquaporin family protein n=1 Tax=Desulfobulbus rhabdoformis TaxID=34032 RepID=UPI0019658E82|nr:MIP/aquaporin family protein [Desulfobulbus rhabdoformis]MBM9615884.1 aquaporin family protein [Desulfobulbus rhabdoformis]